ncbi:MAG: MG2 domain-containing protein [Candidatus Fervidibacter sp.]|uniref:MG2 domain-containing protein n=1 Tax=Candidatus Fervidibacter sp. TaxID=3100871 RepID=UPI0040492292
MGQKERLTLLTLIWVVYGVVTLIQSEPPCGRVVGKVIASETGQALAKAKIWFNHPDGSWRVESGHNGSFELSNLPTGTYIVTASTYAHHLQAVKLTLDEGKTHNLLLALDPIEPFLELIHPQSVFHPNETIKIGVRGFSTDGNLEVQVWKVEFENSPPAVPITTVLRLLEELRSGWWHGTWELRDALKQIAPCLTKVSEKSVPIDQRDEEGVFLKFLPIDLPTEGIYLVRVSTEGKERVALLNLTKVGVVVKVGNDRNDAPSAFTYVADLETGEPIGGVEVSAWVRERAVGREQDRLISSSITNENGMAHLSLKGLNVGSASACFFVASKPTEKFSPITWVAVDEYHLGEALNARQRIFGAIYTDRPVYRPGNTVHFKGIVREQTQKGYITPKPTPLTVLIKDPDGNIVHRTEMTLTKFGSFSGSLRLNEEVPTGTYTLEAELKNGLGPSNRILGSFAVAAYRKPEVQVTVKPARRRFTLSETVTVLVAVRYYFGMPVANAKVSYWVTRLPVADESEFDHWDEGYGGEIILEGETRTGADGKAVIRFQLSDLLLKEHPSTEFRCEINLTVGAAGYQFAEGAASFLVTQGDWKLKVSCEPSFVGESEKVVAKAKVIDWDTEKPQAKVVVNWRAGLTEWRGKETKIRWLLKGKSETNEKGEAEWQFEPSESGDWIVEATVYDKYGNAIGSETYLWVTPLRYAPSLPPKLPPLQLWLDKQKYRVGEEAKIAVRSGVRDSFVLLTVEGERLHYAKLLKLTDGVARWKFEVSRELLPNAYVTASLVWQKKFAEQSEPLRFDLDNFWLKVSVESDRDVYGPRQPAKLTVQVRNADGKPVKAELSVAVVDEAIYAIRKDDPEQVFRAFYSERPNKVVTMYSFPWLAWQGDKGEAETVRKHFPDTALWLPHIVTDEKGIAQVQLTIPDTLTQWRVTAIAHTLDTRVGFGVAKFRCAKPFGVRIAAPILLTQGDQTTVTAIVHSKQKCEVKVEGDIRLESAEAERQNGFTVGESASSPPISLEPRVITVHPNKIGTVKWNFTAQRSGRLTITVRAESDNGQKDAEQRTITVVPHATERIASRTVMLSVDETERVLNFTLLSNADLETSRVDIRLAPSIFSAVLGALEYLATYPYGCVEQTMNSFLPDLLVWQIMKERRIKVGWLENELPKMVQKGLTRLYRFQHEDGGWGWWEDDKTNLWMTALVVRGLAEAKRAGFDVSESVLKAGVKTLERMLRANWQEQGGDDVAFALFALSRAGMEIPKFKPASNFSPVGLPATRTSFIEEVSKRCSPYGLAFLTLALHEWRHPEAKKFAQKLLGTAVPLQECLRWTTYRSSRMWHWTTDDEMTAWALLALMRTEIIGSETATATVKSLLKSRKGDGWVSTKDTAAVLEAMLEFARRFERERTDKPIPLTILLNGSPTEIQLPANSDDQPETTVKLKGYLRKGANEVKIVKPKGFTLWVTLVSRQCLVLPERTGKLLASARILGRTYEKLVPYTEEGGQVRWEAKLLETGDTVKVGDIVAVTLTASCPTDFMVLEDPIPAGMRVIESEELLKKLDSREMGPKEVRDDRTVTYFRYAGQYKVRYLLRAEIPGDYHVLPPRLWHMYGTERWNGAEERLGVLP